MCVCVCVCVCACAHVCGVCVCVVPAAEDINEGEIVLYHTKWRYTSG